MKKEILIVVLIFFILSSQAIAKMTGKVTAKVVDEEGAPIEGANVNVSFKFAQDRDVGLQTKAVLGVSDKSGLFTAKGQGMASISLSAIKDGYYKSGRGYKFTSSSKLLNRWEPWNPIVEVVLKKKHNPIPMYIKYIDSIKMPVIGAAVGYDLEIGDWVTPYGRGIISDFIFNFTSVDREWTDYECGYTLMFSNEKDGIQEFIFDNNNQSYYRWPFQAPVYGYIGELKKSKIDSSKIGFVTDTNKEINYLFRVRTKTDENGNIIDARYGKIKGEINVWPGKIKFFYYFNPDGTRNLEEDPEKNLFDMK